MKRASLSQTLPLVLLAVSAVCAAPAADQRGGAATTTIAGAYALTFHIDAPPTVPDGAAVTCKARIAPRLTTFDNLSALAFPVLSKSAVARVEASAADCSLLLPFAFAVGSHSGGAELSYEIDVLPSRGPFLRTADRASQWPIRRPEAALCFA